MLALDRVFLQGGSMNNNANKTSHQRSFREKLFPYPLRVPTERQVLTWEDEGGNLSTCEDIVIINGVLCRTWTERVRASFISFWDRIRGIFR